MSLIVGTRQGAAPNLGIGVFVAPGQSGCWLLTLLAVPSFYSLFQDIAKQITARLAPFRPAARVRK